MNGFDADQGVGTAHAVIGCAGGNHPGPLRPGHCRTAAIECQILRAEVDDHARRRLLESHLVGIAAAVDGVIARSAIEGFAHRTTGQRVITSATVDLVNVDQRIGTALSIGRQAGRKVDDDRLRTGIAAVIQTVGAGVITVAVCVGPVDRVVAGIAAKHFVEIARRVGAEAAAGQRIVAGPTQQNVNVDQAVGARCHRGRNAAPVGRNTGAQIRIHRLAARIVRIVRRGHEVIAGASGDGVVAGTAFEQLGHPVAQAVGLVCDVTAGQAVIARAAPDPFHAGQRQAALCAGGCMCGQVDRPRRRRIRQGQNVSARPAVNRVVADGTGGRTALESVVTRPARQNVGTTQAKDLVGTRAAGQGVRTVVGRDAGRVVSHQQQAAVGEADIGGGQGIELGLHRRTGLCRQGDRLAAIAEADAGRI